MKRPQKRASHRMQDPALEAFDRLWPELFLSSAHLDGLLARLGADIRPALATAVPAVLRAPSALARAAGLRVAAGEPWSLDAGAKARWAPARALVELALAGRLPRVDAGLEDYPPAMVASWVDDFGANAAEGLAQTLGETPPVTLRAARAAGRARVADLLAEELGVAARPTTFAPLGLELERFAAVSRLRRESGVVEIQDEGSQILALFALEPERFGSCFTDHPGAPLPTAAPLELPRLRPRTVIDACAGAGGKTLAMADALENRGRIFAYDISARRLEELRRRATRAGLTSVKTLAVEDGREAEVARRFAGSAEVVLVDAPCSGWGVLRRNPDLKWRQEPEAPARLEMIEARLLDGYSGLVAPGGRLVYATCTFRRAETTAVVDAFASSHPDFERAGRGFFGPASMDGFFAAAFTRRG